MSMDEGLEALRVTEAILDSARTGRAVRLAQPPGPARPSGA